MRQRHRLLLLRLLVPLVILMLSPHFTVVAARSSAAVAVRVAAGAGRAVSLVDQSLDERHNRSSTSFDRRHRQLTHERNDSWYNSILIVGRLLIRLVFYFI